MTWISERHCWTRPRLSGSRSATRTRRRLYRPVPAGHLQQLFRHVGAETFGRRRSSPNVAASLSTRAKCATASRPTMSTAAIDWLNDGAQQIIIAVDQVGSDARVWTFLGLGRRDGGSAGGCMRSSVHLADAALAVGADYNPAPDLAADAINEWIELRVVQASGNHRRSTGDSTLHLHATDAGLVRPVSGRSSTTRTVCPGHTTTARVMSRCVARSGICCWRLRAGVR